MYRQRQDNEPRDSRRSTRLHLKNQILNQGIKIPMYAISFVSLVSKVGVLV